MTWVTSKRLYVSSQVTFISSAPHSDGGHLSAWCRVTHKGQASRCHAEKLVLWGQHSHPQAGTVPAGCCTISGISPCVWMEVVCQAGGGRTLGGFPNPFPLPLSPSCLRGTPCLILGILPPQQKRFLIENCPTQSLLLPDTPWDCLGRSALLLFWGIFSLHCSSWRLLLAFQGQSNKINVPSPCTTHRLLASLCCNFGPNP